MLVIQLSTKGAASRVQELLGRTSGLGLAGLKPQASSRSGFRWNYSVAVDAALEFQWFRKLWGRELVGRHLA